jgi:hypothetical protein
MIFKNKTKYIIGIIIPIIMFLILFIFILYIVIKIKKGFLFSGWYGYRLGDVVRFGTNKLDKLLLSLCYNNSIAHEYMQLTNKNNDFKTLKQIVKKRKNVLPNNIKNIATIHIRIGDIIECDTHSVDEMLENQILSKQNKKCIYHITEKEKYVKPSSYYKNIKFPKNLKEIYIIAGSHKIFLNYNKSLKYIYKVQKIIQKNINNTYSKDKIPVNLKLGDNPDEDFLWMIYSKFNISSGGGYSKIIENVREYLQK